jgi:hypothetical protein
MRYKFIHSRDGENFELSLKPTETIWDVKAAIQKKYGLAERSDVTLLFAGKALLDQFVLERLRIGSTKIVVSTQAGTDDRGMHYNAFVLSSSIHYSIDPLVLLLE